MEHIQIIKTNIKFYKGLDGISEKVYGFVTKVGSSWLGCRQNVEKKKIVFVDPMLEAKIVPNRLYKCSLEPMRDGGGFIAKSATLVKFKATIASVCKHGTYKVYVKFGNKQIVYAPSSEDKHKSDIRRISNLLQERIDLHSPEKVIEEFVDSACMVKMLYQNYLKNVH